MLKPREGFGGAGVTIMSSAGAAARRRALGLLRRRPEGFVAQEAVRLSTHPTVCGARLRPRRVDLRPFVLSTPAGARSMPGGLTRYAPGAGEPIVNSSRGGGCKDTWVISSAGGAMRPRRRSLASRRQRPLIGVTTSEVRPAERVEPLPEGEPRGKEMALGLPYLRGLEAAGALPVVVPPLMEEAIEPLLDRLDGICLSGGPDLDPANYGAGPHPELGPTEPDLDRFELAIARRADARAIPVLAICRGSQALNVIRGGTLHQHIPEISAEIPHRQGTAGDQTSHAVEIEPGTALAAAVGQARIEVNSFHHQAIDRVGEGLVVSARAPDGTVEAVEDPDRRFLIGVQWHAETLVHRPFERALFELFVEACREDRAAFRRRRDVA